MRKMINKKAVFIEFVEFMTWTLPNPNLAIKNFPLSDLKRSFPVGLLDLNKLKQRKSHKSLECVVCCPTL